jgi:hypothetical protein
MFRRVPSALILSTSILTALLIIVSTNSWAQYATVGPYGGVVLVNAPPIALPAVFTQPRAGISLADRTGISNNSPEAMEVVTVGSGGALFNGSAIANGAAIYNGAALGTTTVPDGMNANETNGTAASTSRARRDWGPSVFAGEGPVGGPVKPAASAPTLAEIAAKLKASPGRSRQTYTNADAQRISDNLKYRRSNNVNQPNTAPPQPPR